VRDQLSSEGGAGVTLGKRSLSQGHTVGWAAIVALSVGDLESQQSMAASQPARSRSGIPTESVVARARSSVSARSSAIVLTNGELVMQLWLRSGWELSASVEVAVCLGVVDEHRVDQANPGQWIVARAMHRKLVCQRGLARENPRLASNQEERAYQRNRTRYPGEENRQLHGAASVGQSRRSGQPSMQEAPEAALGRHLFLLRHGWSLRSVE
jgi:hypothetical protein